MSPSIRKFAIITKVIVTNNWKNPINETLIKSKSILTDWFFIKFLNSVIKFEPSKIDSDIENQTPNPKINHIV